VVEHAAPALGLRDGAQGGGFRAGTRLQVRWGVAWARAVGGALAWWGGTLLDGPAARALLAVSTRALRWLRGALAQLRRMRRGALRAAGRVSMEVDGAFSWSLPDEPPPPKRPKRP
jgi:hypothetical protein